LAGVGAESAGGCTPLRLQQRRPRRRCQLAGRSRSGPGSPQGPVRRPCRRPRSRAGRGRYRGRRLRQASTQPKATAAESNGSASSGARSGICLTDALVTKRALYHRPGLRRAHASKALCNSAVAQGAKCDARAAGSVDDRAAVRHWGDRGHARVEGANVAVPREARDELGEPLAPDVEFVDGPKGLANTRRLRSRIVVAASESATCASIAEHRCIWIQRSSGPGEPARVCATASRERRSPR
jgi:hypothetical protein